MTKKPSEVLELHTTRTSLIREETIARREVPIPPWLEAAGGGEVEEASFAAGAGVGRAWRVP